MSCVEPIQAGPLKEPHSRCRSLCAPVRIGSGGGGETAQGIEPGLVSERESVVTQSETAAAVGSGLVAGLATAALLAWMEAVCVQAVHPQLAPGQTTVGTQAHLEGGADGGEAVRIPE